MKTVRDRVLNILITAMNEHSIANGYDTILCSGGWVPWWVFSSIAWCGSTQGDRRLRELRVDSKVTSHYIFEQKHDGQKYYYRIRPKPVVAQSRLSFAEV